MTKRSCFLFLMLFALVAVPAVSFAQKTRPEAGRKSAKTQNVVFGSTEALTDGEGVLLKWRTSFENKVLGFEVYRSSGGSWERLGPNIVPGGYMSIEPEATYGREYRFYDLKGGFNSQYLIRAVTLSGKGGSSRIFYPEYEGNFVGAAGSTAEELRSAAMSSAPISEKYAPARYDRVARESLVGGLPPDLTTQFWVASQPGVKIGVKQNGIYRVSRTDLANAGFDVNTDEANWQLYLDGNEQSIIVAENGDYIEFYGKGIDTRATDTNIYFLVVGDSPGLRIASAFRKPNGSTPAPSYKEEYYRRDRSIYVTSIANGDKENFFGQVISPTPANIQFDLDSIDFNVPKARIVVGVQGFTALPHKILVSVNGVMFGSFQFSGKVYQTADFGIPTSVLVEGTNTVQMTAIGGSSDFSLVESVYIRYPREYAARADQLHFPVPLNKEVTVTGFADSNIRVFNISSPDHPSLVSNAVVQSQAKIGATNSVTIPSSMSADMLAVSDTALKSPASIVANAPSDIHTESNTWNMLILTYADWKAQADTWATYRTGQGTSSTAVDIVDVYDEFNFGRRGPEAIKGLIEHTRASWASPPDYIMLMGDATYDPKNYTGAGYFDYVPTDMIETSYEETGSDESLADFDEDGLSVVSIGRIPARNAGHVTNALNKVMGFESGLASAWPRGALCASDITQIVDFAAECAEVIDQLPAAIPKVYINKADPNARANLLAEMNLGKYIINYSGHGSTIGWSSGGFFGTGDVDALANQNALTIFTMLTCLNGYFTDTTAYGLSERLIHATGGAAATWSSSGKTTPDVQKVLALRFYDQLANNASMNKMGDLVKDAKTAVIAGRDVRLSWTLLGDPAMKVK